MPVTQITSRQLRQMHDVDHAGCGVLLRLFDIMMTLLKFGVLLKLGFRTGTEQPDITLEEVECALNAFNDELCVLLPNDDPDPPLDASSPGRRAIERVFNLVNNKGKWWLLAPQWVLDDARRGDVRKFLCIE